MNIFAHAGEEHATETDSFVHVLKENGWQILAVTAVFVIIAVVISSYTKKKSQPEKEETHAEEDSKTE
jgi:uncharacterized protein involved in exopolysaccharide biosynthesis